MTTRTTIPVPAQLAVPCHCGSNAVQVQTVDVGKTAEIVSAQCDTHKGETL